MTNYQIGATLRPLQGLFFISQDTTVLTQLVDSVPARREKKRPLRTQLLIYQL